ncbi:helix-turn-helix domain-containing protein [Streptomyces youssoufiensis]
MGRRENPIATCDRELEKLARYLRAQRDAAGVSYKDLAARSGVSSSTLIRAASGQQTPKLKTVRAYAQGCGADPDDAERLWKRARYRAFRGCQEAVPHPRYVRNFAELHLALTDLYQKDGARPYRELEQASNRVLAHATVGRFLRQEGGRPTLEFVRAFALACGARGRAALREWEEAWSRAEEQRMGGKPAFVTRRRAHELVHPDGRLFFHLDPERTRDGREVRRVTLAGPEEELSLIRRVIREKVDMADGFCTYETCLSTKRYDALSALTPAEMEAARSLLRTSRTRSRHARPVTADAVDTAAGSAVQLTEAQPRPLDIPRYVESWPVRPRSRDHQPLCECLPKSSRSAVGAGEVSQATDELGE